MKSVTVLASGMSLCALLSFGCSSSFNGNAHDGGGNGSVDGGPGEPDGGGGNPADAGGMGPFTVDMFDTHCLSTPDPDVAASNDLVGTAIQWTAYFHKKDGTLDHKYEWPAHRGSLISDTHIVFDPMSQRWFMTTIVDLGNFARTGVQIMVSTDKTATDWKYSVPIEMPRLIDDPQPTVTADKVVISESGSCVWAVDKAALFAGDAPSVDPIRCDLQQNNQMAATKSGLPQPTTGHTISMSDQDHINWVAIDGTPAGSNLVATEHVVSVPHVDEVDTFGGLTQFGQDIESGQVKGMWHNDHLAWTKTVKCNGVSCVRLFDIDTATNTVTSQEFSLAGTQLFYGGAAIDKHGNIWVLMAAAKRNGAVGLALAGVRANGMVEPVNMIVTGQSQLSGNRFGDYFAAAQDPADGSVWLIGQYAATNNPQLNPENSAGCKVVHVTAH